MPKKGGVVLGSNEDNDKWRCSTCKRLNSIEHDVCQMCDDPRPNAGKKIEEG